MLPPARHGADLCGKGLRVHVVGHDHVFHVHGGYGLSLSIVGAYCVDQVTQQGFHVFRGAFADEAGHDVDHARFQPSGHFRPQGVQRQDGFSPSLADALQPGGAAQDGGLVEDTAQRVPGN